MLQGCSVAPIFALVEKEPSRNDGLLGLLNKHDTILFPRFYTKSLIVRLQNERGLLQEVKDGAGCVMCIALCDIFWPRSRIRQSFLQKKHSIDYCSMMCPWH